MGEIVKAYKTYAEQVDLLVSRGMEVDDSESAIETLRRAPDSRVSVVCQRPGVLAPDSRRRCCTARFKGLTEVQPLPSGRVGRRAWLADQEHRRAGNGLLPDVPVGAGNWFLGRSVGYSSSR